MTRGLWVVALMGCASGATSRSDMHAHPAPRPAPTSIPAAPVPAAAAPSATASTEAQAPPPAEPVFRLPGETPAPEGFVDVTMEQKSRCGRFTIEHLTDDPKLFEPHVRVTDDTGKIVYAARGREYDIGEGSKFRMSLVIDRCGDLTGDGIPELMMTERTMGAHCCYTHYVVSLTQPTRELLMWEKGDAGHGMVPVKWKDGPSWQLMSMDLVLPPFNPDKGDPVVGGYAGIPAYPIVFELVGGQQYQKRTFRYAKELARERDELQARCKKVQDDCADSELHAWGLALIIGDWNERKTELVTDAEFRAALDKRAAAMRSTLQRALGP